MIITLSAWPLGCFYKDGEGEKGKEQIGVSRKINIYLLSIKCLFVWMV